MMEQQDGEYDGTAWYKNVMMEQQNGITSSFNETRQTIGTLYKGCMSMMNIAHTKKSCITPNPSLSCYSRSIRITLHVASGIPYYLFIHCCAIASQELTTGLDRRKQKTSQVNKHKAHGPLYSWLRLSSSDVRPSLSSYFCNGGDVFPPLVL